LPARSPPPPLIRPSSAIANPTSSASVQPGGGRILQCLKSHKQEMTVGCAQGLAKLKAGMGK
jgi:hypothetical protein